MPQFAAEGKNDSETALTTSFLGVGADVYLIVLCKMLKLIYYKTKLITGLLEVVRPNVVLG